MGWTLSVTKGHWALSGAAGFGIHSPHIILYSHH